MWRILFLYGYTSDMELKESRKRTSYTNWECKSVKLILKRAKIGNSYVLESAN